MHIWQRIGDWMAAVAIVAASATVVYGAVEWAGAVQAAAPAAASAFTVCVDAGHGGFDGGAVGANTGTAEAGLNLSVARLLAGELSARGMLVVMTRENDAALATTKKKDMAARRSILRGENVDLVVSVHMNMFPDAAVSGPMAYYMTGSEEGRRLAQCVIDAVCDATGRARRLANPGDYFVLRECPSPAVIVECGFLSNAEDEQRLLDPAYQQTLSAAVAEGVSAYVKGGGAGDG